MKRGPASGQRVSIYKKKSRISLCIVTHVCIKTLAHNCTLQINKFTTLKGLWKQTNGTVLSYTNYKLSLNYCIHTNTKEAIKVPFVNFIKRICFATFQKNTVESSDQANALILYNILTTHRSICNHLGVQGWFKSSYQYHVGLVEPTVGLIQFLWISQW